MPSLNLVEDPNPGFQAMRIKADVEKLSGEVSVLNVVKGLKIQKEYARKVLQAYHIRHAGTSVGCKKRTRRDDENLAFS